MLVNSGDFSVISTDGESVRIDDTPFESVGDAIAARFLMQKLIEIEPYNDQLNEVRQRVIDHWPFIMPKL